MTHVTDRWYLRTPFLAIALALLLSCTLARAQTRPATAPDAGVAKLLAEIKAMRKSYKDETGEALPMAQAMLELNAKLAPYLPAGGGGAGQPRAGQAQNPGGQSRPSSSTKSPGGVAGIPPSASARVAPVRPITEEERRQELTPEFFADIGLW